MSALIKKKNKPLISIIIVNWNGAEVIGECLESVRKQAYKNIEVIVVDNASSDNSIDIIKSYKLPIKIILLQKNVGFAEGNNIAAKKSHGRYVFLLNSDAMLARHTLRDLTSFMKLHDDVGVAQPAILFKHNAMHGDGTINSIGAYMTYTGFLYYFGYGKRRTSRYKKQSDIFSAYGAGMMIRRRVIEKIGLFDPDFFAYFEESDFSFRALIAGWRIVYVPNTIVYHQGGVAADTYGSAPILFHSYKNRLCSYAKNSQGLTLLWLAPIQILSMIVLSVVYVLKGNSAISRAILHALIWNGTNLRATMRKRKEVKILRTVSDRSIFTRVLRNPRLSYYLYLLGRLQYYTD